MLERTADDTDDVQTALVGDQASSSSYALDVTAPETEGEEEDNANADKYMKTAEALLEVYGCYAKDEPPTAAPDGSALLADDIQLETDEDEARRNDDEELFGRNGGGKHGGGDADARLIAALLALTDRIAALEVAVAGGQTLTPLDPLALPALPTTSGTPTSRARNLSQGRKSGSRGRDSDSDEDYAI